MIELLKSIPGPHFLLYYTIFAILVLIIARKLLQNDPSSYRKFPDATKMDPYAIAYLTQGLEGTIMLALFKLRQAKKIDMTTVDGEVRCTRLTDNQTGLSPIESSIFKTISPTCYTVRDIINHNFNPYLSLEIKNLKRDLQESGLLPDESIIDYKKRIKVSSYILLIVTGGAKLLIGINYHRPIFYLMMVIVISIVVCSISLCSNQKTTLQKRFLSIYSEKFRWLRENPSPSRLTPANIIFGFALFGFSAFAGTALADALALPVLEEAMKGAFAPNPNNSGSGTTSGGCGGSGCSGSSGDGGSSDGGGGGCGGCGGGGGD
jgi:uncharacterized protein (TIGR04222 family)